MKNKYPLLILLIILNSIFTLSHSQTKPVLTIPIGHTVGIEDISFSKDRNVIFTRDENSNSFVWDTKTGKFLYRKSEDKFALRKAELNKWKKNYIRPDTCKKDGRIVYKYDEKTILVKDSFGRNILTIKTSKPYLAKFSPNGNDILAYYKKKAIVFNSSNGKEKFTIKPKSILYYDIEYSHNGKYILIPSLSDVKIWNAKNGKVINTIFEDENNLAMCAKFSLDDKTIVAGHKNGNLNIWDTETGELKSEYGNSITLPKDIIYSSDNKKYLTIEGGNIKIWNLYSGELLHTLKGKDAKYYDNTYYDGIYYNKENYPGDVSSAKFNSDGKYILLTRKRHKKAEFWNAITGELLSEIDDNNLETATTITNAFFYKDDMILTNVGLWKIKDKERLQFIKFLPYQSYDYLIPNTKIGIKLKHKLSEVLIINTENVNNNPIVLNHTYVVNSIYNPSNNTLITISKNIIKIWNIYSGKLESTFNIKSTTNTTNGINEDKYRYSLNNNKLAFGYKNFLKVININTGKLIYEIDHSTKRTSFHVDMTLLNPNGKTLVTIMGNKIFFRNAENGILLNSSTIHTDDIVFSKYSSDGKFLMTVSYDGSTILWDGENNEMIVRTISLNPNHWLHLTEDNYYYGNKNSLKDLYWVQNKSKIYQFEQFDLKYNRPDIILSKLGYKDTTLIKAYHKAYLKRLKKMGFKEEELEGDFHIPDSKINNFEYLPTITDSSDIELNLHFEDNKYKLDRINIWINNVAIYGINGINLREENISNIDKDIKLKLVSGENKIQVSCLNQKGAESYKETINITYKPKQETKPNLYLISIGTSEYKDSRFNLQYAAKDANDIVNLFKQDKYFGEVITKTLTNQQVTKESVSDLKNFLKQATRNDQVIIFIAGHGVLDVNLDYYLASNDMDFNYPEKRGIAYEELEGVLDGIKPLKKILFVDACHSGEIDKEEVELAQVANTEVGEITFRSAGAGVINKTNNLGLRNTSELTKELFTDLRRGTGATVVSSAGGGEYAMESGEWKNGLFTYSLINGIQTKKADLNNDGKIMLSELQKYVQAEVVKLSKGKQQPTSRIENITMDFRVW